MFKNRTILNKAQQKEE